MGTIKLNKRRDKSEEQASKQENFSIDISDERDGQVVTEQLIARVVDCKFAEKDGGFVEEIKELRTANETVYRRNDGTCRKIITASPTRYRDVNGKYKEISNKLIDNGQGIVNEANSFNVKFDKNANTGKIFDLQRDGKKLTLSTVGSSKTRGHVCGCKCELCAETDNSVTATLDDGTEIQYVTLNDRLKENIIVKGRRESYEYDFKLDIGDLIVEEGENNELLLKDKQTGLTEFRIPAPYMYDASKKYSNKVSYEIDVNGCELAIKVVADSEFINAEERAFPVTIDPQIIVNSNSILCYSKEFCNINDALETTYPNTLEAYRRSSSERVTAYIEFVKPTVLDIARALNQEDVTDELITIKRINLIVHCCEGYGNIVIGDTGYNLSSYENIDSSGEDFYIDITDTNEKRIIIKYDEGETGEAHFDVSGINAPRIEVDYIVETPPVEDDFAVSTKPAIKEIELTDKVKGFLYLKEDAFSAEFDSVVVSDLAVPFRITHINKAGLGKSVYGMNWRLNLDKKLRADIDSDTVNNTKYLYTDELGDNYVFSEKYYYMKESNDVTAPSIKTLIENKSQIKTDMLGNLTYDGHPVYKQYDCNGYILIPEINDFIGSDFIEQRHEELIQLEEYIDGEKMSLESYNVVKVEQSGANGETVTNICSTEKDSNESYLKFIKRKYNELLSFIGNNSSNEYYMTDSEATQLKSLYVSLEQLNLEISEEETKEAKNTSKIENLERQKLIACQQIKALKDYANNNLIIVKNKFIKFIGKHEEMDLLKLQNPVNYLQDKDGIISGFNYKGDFVLLCDAYGNYVSIGYDSDNRISKIFDSNNKVIKFFYENGLLKSITDSYGRGVTFKYDYKTDKTKNKLIEINFPDGSKIEFQDKSDKLGIIKSGCCKTSLSYFKNSNKLQKIKREGESPRKGIISEIYLTPYSNGILLEEEGNTEEYRFYKKGKIKQYKNYNYTCKGNTTKYTYETLSDRKKVTAVTNNSDGKSTVIIEEYDNFDMLINRVEDWQNVSSTVKIKTETQYEYDFSGNVVKSTVAEITDLGNSISQNIHVTNYSYNAANKLILTESYTEGEEKTSGINFEQRVYNDNGNMVKCIRWNSLDSSTKFYEEYEREEDGTVKYEKDETGAYSAMYEYVNGTNLVNSVTFANGSKLAYGRNPHNDKVTAITQSTAEGEANTNNIEYGVDGLPAKVKCGNTTLEYSYDAKGRKTEVKVNGSIQETIDYVDSYSYDENTNEYSLGVQTRKLKTGAGDIILSVFKEGKLGDGGGIRETETISAGNTVLEKNEYNEKGWLTQKEYKTESNAARYTVYTYDTYGKPTSIKTKTTPSDTTDLCAENYYYNEYGNLSQRQLTGDVTQIYNYAYKNTAARELDSVSVNGYKFKPLTDVYGRNTGKEFYNGSTKFAGEYITYRKVGDHATNMPACVQYAVGNKYTENIRYKYDSCGNISEITQNGHLVARYTYDSLNRLIREDNKPLNKTVVFTYDNAGNITQRCRYAFTEYSVANNGENGHDVYEYDGDKLVSYNGAICEYNNLGSPTKYKGKVCGWRYGKWLTKYDTHNFAYDSLNRLTFKDNTKLTYDSDGRLIKQGNDLEFFYDESGVAAVKYNNVLYFYRKDAQGNIVALLDVNGNVEVKYKYDAWGLCKVTNSNDSEITDTNHIANKNPFRYRGYYYDTATGLYYLQSRYYDPEVGRFISQDSVEYADPETINGLNLYAYCGNNPVMNVDPTGTILISILIGLIVGAAVGATVGGYVAGKKAYENGARGWELFGWTLLGVFGGGIIGGAAGAFVGWAAPAIGSFLGSSFTLAKFALASGEVINISITGGQALSALGLLIWFASNEKPGNNRKQNEQIRAGIRELGYNPKNSKIKDIINNVEKYIRKNNLSLGYKDLLELLLDFLP